MCPPALYCCVRLCLAILYIYLPALDVASSSFDFEKHKLFGVYGGVIIASRLEAIAIRVEAIASRLETIAIRLEAIASRLEAIAISLEAIVSRLEAIAIRLEAIASSFEAIAIRLEAIATSYQCCYVFTRKKNWKRSSQISLMPGYGLHGPCQKLVFVQSTLLLVFIILQGTTKGTFICSSHLHAAITSSKAGSETLVGSN